MGGILKILLITGLFSMFCTTKVSEWVLLNHVPEDYLLVYHSGREITSEIKAANKAMASKINDANLQFREVKNENLNEPYYGLYVNKRLVRKYSSIAELTGLTSSPLREKIASEIMDGKLCVMLLLKSGNETNDSKSSLEIRKALDVSPFKSVIVYIELERNNAAEVHFVSMLLNVEADLKTINEPMLFGIFGRFRALEPLLAGGITQENVGYMIHFLTADCSCLIKDDLPGTDILFTNNWENPLPALVNKILDENPSLQHL
jgi:hypothetical protein